MRVCGWRARVVLAAVATVVATVVRGQTSPPNDNAELARVSREDQDDRKPGLHGIDWAKVKPRDDARWLVAASEDRFLMKIGRMQRFGTQYEPADEPGKYRLAPTEPQVTDELRAVLGTPSLAEAKATASRFDKK
jgi:hypothetical protein